MIASFSPASQRLVVWIQKAGSLYGSEMAKQRGRVGLELGLGLEVMTREGRGRGV